MSLSRSLFLVLAALAAGEFAHCQETLLLRSPALSADRLAFVYAGDLWIAARDGSNPRRLTAHPAEEGEPVFSPDGRTLAFAASYEDNRDVYVIDVDGGQPRRLTWHPGADIPTGWTADGSVVTFVSDRETDHGRSGQLYHASLEGGLPLRRMDARVYRGVYDDSDSRFAYIAHGSGYNGLFGGSSGWRGYRGGTVPEILILDFDAESLTVVPGEAATNFDPFWLGDTLYFISDRDNERFNLHRYDSADGSITRISNETDWDVRSADGHGETIVYEAGGRLKTLDVATGATRDIAVFINPDLPQRRPSWRAAADTVQASALSPNGKRAIVTARGEVFTVPVKKGSTRNVSKTGAVREYAGIWSPGGDEIAWIEESLGGQSLVVTGQTGMDDARRYDLGPHFYELLAWAGGESARIVFQDNHLRLYAIELGSGRIQTIATGARRETIDAAVSPDGRWLAYTEERPNYHRRLVLHEFDGGEDLVVTTGDADASAPAFSRDGKYLFFAASTNSGPLQVGLNMTSRERPYRAGLYAVVLAGEGASPLAPETGDEAPDADAANGDERDEDADEDEDVVTRVDRAGIADRIVALPVAEANYAALSVGDDGRLYFLDREQPGAVNPPPDDDSAGGNAIRRFDFDEREVEDVLEGVRDFELSASGSHMIVFRADRSLAVAEIGDEVDAEALDTSGLRLMIEPRAEWKQIFDEAWRMEGEYFYDPDVHGLDWDAVYEKFAPLVEHVGRREDLNDLIVEMIAEMQVGHNRMAGGDVHREDRARTGLLGANFDIDDNRYRFARVYTGEAWNPFLEAPLGMPGSSVAAGEYLLAVNGRELSADDNIFRLLQGTAGNQVTLSVAASADGDERRDVVVTPVESEGRLRLWHWIERNRRYVDEASNGRVGYVYLPNTAGDGYDFFNRMFYSQVDKEAMIFDERSNGGGQAANYIVEVLGRPHLSGWKDRDGLVYNTPAGAMHGPKLMMIDQDAGSGGDYLPWAFRHLEIGTLLGTRTWGGLIGIAANPPMIDGARLVVPFFRFFTPDGRWAVENEGVAPDIEVRLDPLLANDGRDSQLERAVEEVLAELAEFEDPVPDEAPPYPTELGE